MPSTYCISLSIAVLCRWPCDRSTVRCVCVCVCHGESSELLKSTEPRGENLLVGIFENAFKWMKLFPLCHFTPLSTLLRACTCSVAPLWACLSLQTKRSVRLFLSLSCIFFGTHFDWVSSRGAWQQHQQQPLWSGKAVWAFVLHLFSATFAFDMHRLKQAATASATAAKASPSTASQLQIRRGNLCMIFGTLPSQLPSPFPSLPRLLVITETGTKWHL